MNALTEDFTKAIEAQFEKLNKDVADALTQAGVAAAIAGELEQKMVRRGGAPGSDQGASWGQQFVNTKGADAAALHGVSSGKVSMEFKATITSATTDADGSAGGLVVPQRDALVQLPKRRLTIRQLLNVVNVSSNAVEYPKVEAVTNAAAMVAEGAAKPESGLQISLETAPIRTLAHWMKASRQILDDAPQLAALIDVELRYGLALIEEAELLTGDGTGQHLEGMIPQATAFDEALLADTVDYNMIDQVGIAILQASLTNVQPDGIIIHPADWWRMRLLKDADGKYILGDPGTVVTPALFGLPVVATEAMAVDDFLVGSFASQTLYDRWQARVELGYVNDDFTRNLTTVLGEQRVGFAAKRPESLIYGDFGNSGA